MTCHGAKHVWVDVTLMVSRSTTHAVLFKLLYFEVFQIGGWRTERPSLLKGRAQKVLRRFYWGQNCRDSKIGTSGE